VYRCREIKEVWEGDGEESREIEECEEKRERRRVGR
jgi:hypothetical protein